MDWTADTTEISLLSKKNRKNNLLDKANKGRLVSKFQNQAYKE
jgi:hypothetical protein